MKLPKIYHGFLSPKTKKTKKTLLKKGFRHSCFPVDSTKFLRRSFLHNTVNVKVVNKTSIQHVCKITFFFYLGFLSGTFTNHGTAGEGGRDFFNSSLPLPHALQTLRH